MRQRVRAAGRAGVLVGDVVQPLVQIPLEDGGQARLFVRARREILVAVEDRPFIPRADAHGVGLRKVYLVFAIQGDVGRRVIHDGAASVRAPGEIMLEAERVAHLVRGQLAQPRQGHLQQARIGCRAVFVGLEQALGDEEILPHAQRPQRDAALDDLAGARIDHRCPVGPAARRAVDPLDDVVAHVHGVSVRGEQFDLEGVLVACRRKRLVPPRRAFKQGGANRLRRAGVEVIDDGVHRRAAGGGRVFLCASGGAGSAA